MAGKRKRLSAGRPKGNPRPRKRRYLVVTNGEVTEPQYFSGLTAELGDVVIEVRHFRADPAALAAKAKDLKASEESEDNATGSRSADGFQRVFVVTDVDQFTAEQFKAAKRTCKASGMELVISNPCFEVWLVDHLLCCPETFTETRDVEGKAVELKIVGGSHDKHVDYSVIKGKRDDACANARSHNTAERKTMRDQLSKMSFAPWTDMPTVIEQVAAKKDG